MERETTEVVTSTRVTDRPFVEAVGADVRRHVLEDPRWRRWPAGRSTLGFLMSIGLTVRDPADRAALLVRVAPYAFRGKL